MPYFTFWPDVNDMKHSGFGEVAHVPCIFNTSGEYEDALSWYLRDRALANWSPSPSTFQQAVRRRYLTRKSLRTFSDSIINMLEWSEYQGRDWRTLRYTEDIVNGYQDAMLTGAWSVRAKKLSAATINLRVCEGCNYLRWAGEKGLREPFSLLTESVPITVDAPWTSEGSITRDVEVRVGRVRPNPKDFDIPTDEAVQSWHRELEFRRGYTKALVCELIIKSGIRREEAVEWRIDTLPINEADWTVRDGLVVVTVKYGAKGEKYVDDNGDEYGPERKVSIPLPLAHRLADYRMCRRPGSRAKYAQAAKTLEEKKRRSREKERRLFLSEATGERISAQTLYNAWTENTKQPFVGWSPHFGRNYWACKRLIELLRQDARRHGIKDNEPMPAWVMANAPSYIDLFVQPQLGHVNRATTAAYLVWLSQMFSMDALQEAYSAELDSIVTSLGYEA